MPDATPDEHPEPLDPTTAPRPAARAEDENLLPEEFLNPETLGLFSRSPQPYSFHPSRLAANLRQTSAFTSPNESGNEAYRNRNNGTNSPSGIGHLKHWRRLSAWSVKTPSESGTEANDEGSYGYGLVRALPPAPLKLHKGLRDENAMPSGGSARTSIESLHVTPGEDGSRDAEQVLDDDGDYFGAGQSKRTESAETPQGAESRSRSVARRRGDAELARIRARKKRRGEIARRIVEMALVTEIELLVLSEESVRNGSQPWKSELISRTAVIWTLSAMYPLRLVWYRFMRRRTLDWTVLKAIRVPTTFDPTPILYPTLIPVLVAASLVPTSNKYLLPNAVLCLAALPEATVPWASSNPRIGYMLHWMLSLIPLLLSQHAVAMSKVVVATPYSLKVTPDGGLDPETIACLFPLHQALLVPLRFVTSTSLLSAELQLLSVALINLLMFATSPQAVLLAILLWFGGIALFITCGPVVRWAIALARIPKWRLRRAGRIVGAQQSFISALNESLRAKRATRATVGPHSSDEKDAAGTLSGSFSRLETVRKDVLSRLKTNLLSVEDDETKSAVEPLATKTSAINSADAQSARKRRNTLPPNLSRQTSQRTKSLSTPPSKRAKRHRSPIVRYFLALTPQQATARKWYYASYVYTAIVVIVAGPAWYLASRYVLNGREALGWAIGYLFGNVPSMRFFIVKNNLESWIPLPPLDDASGGIPLSHRFPSYLFWIHPLMRSLGLAPGPATTRLLLCLYCGVCVLVGLTTVILLRPIMEVDTRRKVFHFTMVALLLPSIAIDPCFISFALGLVLAAFLLLELVRASQLPPFSKPIAVFLAPYVDGRDLRGPVVVSHIFLLGGCAVPLWLGMAAVAHAPPNPFFADVQGTEDPWLGWSTPERSLDMLAGVVCVGLGDAFASLVGRRFGRHKWPWCGGKSLEGSLAFAAAVVAGLVLGRGLLNLVLFGTVVVSTGKGALGTVAKAAVAAAGASLMEAVLTGGNDNVVVPVVLWLLVRGVGL